MGRMSELHIQMQDELINQINLEENGECSVLDTIIYMRKERAFHEEMLNNIKKFETQKIDSIQTEAEQYQNEYKGAKFEFRSGGKTFDYSNIREVQEEEEKLKALKEKYKSAWEMKQKGFEPVTEDGEILELPIPKYRKDSMIVKLPKEKL